MSRLLATLSACLLAVAVALPAGAATPATGTVGAAQPQASWTGTTTDPLGAAELAAIGQNGISNCTAPACDSYKLTVSDPGTSLTVHVETDGTLGVEVDEPAGGPTHFLDGDSPVDIVITNPAAGDYTVKVVGTPNGATPGIDYTAKATLALPATPTPSATATATATAAVTDTPAPSATAPAGTPTPTATATPQPRSTLAVHPDRRELRKAVRYGFRVRLRCSGACDTITVQLSVSPLVARQLHLRKASDGYLVVAETPTLVNARGRIIAHVDFIPAYRTRLLRKKTLPMALTATATDAAGNARAYSQRLVLHRH